MKYTLISISEKYWFPLFAQQYTRGFFWQSQNAVLQSSLYPFKP